MLMTAWVGPYVVLSSFGGVLLCGSPFLLRLHKKEGAECMISLRVMQGKEGECLILRF